jgi:hypothetical protein
MLFEPRGVEKLSGGLPAILLMEWPDEVASNFSVSYENRSPTISSLFAQGALA